MCNVMDWKPPKVIKEFDIPKGVYVNFKAKCKHCTAIISGSQKPAKTSFGMFIQLLSTESETLQSYIGSPGSACFLQ